MHRAFPGTEAVSARSTQQFTPSPAREGPEETANSSLFAVSYNYKETLNAVVALVKLQLGAADRSCRSFSLFHHQGAINRSLCVAFWLSEYMPHTFSIFFFLAPT